MVGGNSVGLGIVLRGCLMGFQRHLAICWLNAK